jgi:hypothetical protein
MDMFCIWHIHNASEEVFWPKNFLNYIDGFKSAILAIFPFYQNGTFEPLHEIQKKNLAKRLLLRHYESVIYKTYP